MVAREPQQQRVQRLAALGVEWGEQLILQAGDDRPQSHQLASSLGREADHVAPAVVGVSLPLDQATLLQRVEDPDELTTVEPERVGDRRLGLAGLLAQDLEDAVVVETEARLLDIFDRL